MIKEVAVEIGQTQETLSRANRLVGLTAGLNLHQLRSLLLECHQQQGKIEESRVATKKSDWIRREDIVEILEPAHGFESVGGYESVKQFIQRNIIGVINHPERAAHFGVPLPKGILLFGPPGTGKSHFSKALAAETHLPFINLKTENLFSQYLGESGRLFNRAIKIAEKNAPCIVFIDEIDRFGTRRSSANDGASEETRRVFNQILEWLGDANRKSILIGTTNRPQDLDKAFTRPGRLDYKVPIFYPNAAARSAILAIHLGLTGVSNPIPVSEGAEAMVEERIRWLAQNTRYFSGAELEELVYRIRRNAFERNGRYVEEKDFARALEHF
ncbi:MAG TPA: ATP-binding protein, partial [Syntrophobacteraceae bacterium]|nr:ATP-binding protein [Syntrophobacteraceae bacterium]